MILNRLRKIASNLGEQSENSIYRKAVGLQVSKSGHLVIINPRVNVPYCQRPSFGDRRPITSFTASSAGRLRKYLRECRAEYRTMVTLTYPHGHGFDGATAKRDLKVFVQRLRRYCGQNELYSSLWFLEFQSRGSVHFHILCTDFIPKSTIAKWWYEIVGSEDVRHLLAGTRIESIRSGRKGISAYAAKYAAKQVQKVVPDDFGWSGRFWGVSGYRMTMSADTYMTAEDLLSMAAVRQYAKLEKMLENYEKEGSIRRITKENSPAIVFYCMRTSAEVLITSQIYQCEISSGLYNAGYGFGMFNKELVTDIGDECQSKHTTSQIDGILGISAHAMLRELQEMSSMTGS